MAKLNNQKRIPMKLLRNTLFIIVFSLCLHKFNCEVNQVENLAQYLYDHGQNAQLFLGNSTQIRIIEKVEINKIEADQELFVLIAEYEQLYNQNEDQDEEDENDNTGNQSRINQQKSIPLDKINDIQSASDPADSLQIVYQGETFSGVQNQSNNNNNEPSQDSQQTPVNAINPTPITIKGVKNVYNDFVIQTQGVSLYSETVVDSMSASIQANNVWEFDNTKMILQLMDKQRIRNPGKQLMFIDVGASIGWYSLAAASRNYSVLAFEPFPTDVTLFKKSIESNQNFEKIINFQAVGLGSENKSCQIYTSSNKDINGNIRCDGSSELGNYVLQGDVEIVTLDSYTDLIPANQRTAFLKLNVEGFEYYILSGGEKFLRKHKVPYILLEYYPRRMLQLGYTPQQLIDKLKSLDYVIHATNFTGKIVNSEEDMFKYLSSKDYTYIYATYKTL
eukprot:403348807